MTASTGLSLQQLQQQQTLDVKRLGDELDQLSHSSTSGRAALRRELTEYIAADTDLKQRERKRAQEKDLMDDEVILKYCYREFFLCAVNDTFKCFYGKIMWFSVDDVHASLDLH